MSITQDELDHTINHATARAARDFQTFAFLREVRERQNAKGLAKHGVALADAGVPLNALYRHASQEAENIKNYVGQALCIAAQNMAEAKSENEFNIATGRYNAACSIFRDALDLSNRIAACIMATQDDD